MPTKFKFRVPGGFNPKQVFTAEKVYSDDAPNLYVVMWIDPASRELVHTTYKAKSVEHAIAEGVWELVN